MLQYTSGSTSDPKGVQITHGNLLTNTESVRTGIGVDANTRFGGWIPNYHDMGLMGLITPPLSYGGSTALMRPTTFLKRPHLWLHMMHRLDVHFSAAPSFAYDLCVRRIRDEQLAGVDLSRWRTPLTARSRSSRACSTRSRSASPRPASARRPCCPASAWPRPPCSCPARRAARPWFTGSTPSS